jgi:hypothetical protein
MSKFTFQCTDDFDGSVVTVEFETEIWVDAFPKFLQLCAGAGFSIAPETALYAPTASEHMFGDRDFLLFDSDFEKCECIKESTPTNPCCEVSKGDFETCVHMDEPAGPPHVVRVHKPGPVPSQPKTLEQWVAEGHAFDCTGGIFGQHSDCYYGNK